MVLPRFVFGVVGDCVETRTSRRGDSISGVEPKMFIQRHDGKSLELPYNGSTFVFSKGRSHSIAAKMAEQAGQQVK